MHNHLNNMIIGENILNPGSHDIWNTELPNGVTFKPDVQTITNIIYTITMGFKRIFTVKYWLSCSTVYYIDQIAVR